MSTGVLTYARGMLVVSAVVLSTFNSLLLKISHYFSYLDELLAVVFLFALLSLKWVPKKVLAMYVLMFGISIYIFVMSLFSAYFRGALLTSVDIVLFFKTAFILLCCLSFPTQDFKVARKYVVFIGKIVLLSAALGYPLVFVSGIMPVFEYRFGFPSYSFVLDNPGEFLNVVFIYMLIVYGFSDRSSRGNRNLWLVVGLFLCLTTLRFKALVLVTFFIGVWFIVGPSVKASFIRYYVVRFSLKKFVYALPVLFVLAGSAGWSQFDKYFLGELTPRLFLTVTGVELAINSFPFGVGAGTFGSAVANSYYSPLYVDLGFVDRWGLSGSDDSNFLSDQFWPLVAAQYGFLGLALICVFYLFVFGYCLRFLANDPLCFIVFVSVMSSLALSTLGSSIFIGSLGVAYLVLASLCVGLRRDL